MINLPHNSRLVWETRSSLGQCVSFSLIDVGSDFTAYILLLFFSTVPAFLSQNNDFFLHALVAFYDQASTNHFFFFLSLDIFCLAGSVQRAQQSAHLA